MTLEIHLNKIITIEEASSRIRRENSDDHLITIFDGINRIADGIILARSYNDSKYIRKEFIKANNWDCVLIDASSALRSIGNFALAAQIDDLLRDIK